MVSCFFIVFCFFTLLLYRQFIGSVGRLSSGAVGEEVISPLILSYCGALIIGVSMIYLITNRKSLNKFSYLLTIIVIVLGVVPFFLGASRGSVLAIFVPFLLLAYCHISLRSFVYYVLGFMILFALFFYLDSYLGSGLIDRILGTTAAIEQGSSSASRIDIWNIALNQFFEYPIFGDKLLTNGLDIYPHNLFVELLQSVGIIGAIPFTVLIIKGFLSCMRIFRFYTTYAWVGVFFIQSFMQNMFSGAVYSAAWFWCSLAVVLALEYNLSNVKRNL